MKEELPDLVEDNDDTEVIARVTMVKSVAVATEVNYEEEKVLRD